MSMLVVENPRRSRFRKHQEVGGNRAQRRAIARSEHAFNAREAFATHFALQLAQPTGRQLLDIAQTQLGLGYAITGCRCLPGCTCRDCSGEIVYSVNTALPTLNYPCTSSWGIADTIRNAGLLITEQQAIWIPGAIGIENAWGTSNGPSGSNGHVVFFDGNGLTTTEAMGRKYGIRHGMATGRNFNAWGLFPGFDYSTQTEKDMETAFFLAPARQQHDNNAPAGVVVDFKNKVVHPINGCALREVDTNIRLGKELLGADLTKDGNFLKVVSRREDGSSKNPSATFSFV